MQQTQSCGGESERERERERQTETKRTRERGRGEERKNYVYIYTHIYRRLAAQQFASANCFDSCESVRANSFASPSFERFKDYLRELGLSPEPKKRDAN